MVRHDFLITSKIQCLQGSGSHYGLTKLETIMRTTDPRSYAPAAFCAAFSIGHALTTEYQRLAAQGRAERAGRILAANARTRAANARTRARRLAEDADAELAQLDADLGLI